jgi:RecA-family ATPase
MRIYDRPFSLPRDFDALIKAIKSTGAILVILDPLTAIIGNNVNISHDQAIREIFTPLALLAESTSCAILIVRHLGKGSSSNPLHRGAGSISIIAAARTGLIIAPHPENHRQRILATTKNNLSKHASDLIYQVVENTHGLPYIQWLGESQFAPSAVFNTGSPMSIARQNILRVLRESDTSLGPLKIAE